MHSLPPDFIARPPMFEDAPAVVALVNANIVQEFGEPDYTLGDLMSLWQRPNFNLAADALLVLSPDGTLVGYTALLDTGNLIRIEQNTSVHADFLGCGLAEYLLAFAENRALAFSSAGTCVVGWVANAQNPWKSSLLQNAGYAPVRHSWIMEIQMTAEPPPAHPPDGIQLAPFRPETDDPLAHQAIQEAFQDNWGHTDLGLDEWKTAVSAHQNFAPDKSFVARSSAGIVGAIMAFEYSDSGWIEQLAVRRSWRKQGLGRALLYTAFGAFYRGKVERIQLAVDSASLTGATRLYSRAGMRPIRHFTRYIRTLRTDTA